MGASERKGHSVAGTAGEYWINFERLVGVAERYRVDAELRERIESGDISDVLSDLGLQLPSDIGVHVTANTEDLFNVVFPPDPNVILDDERLGAITAGAGTLGTVSSSGSVSTLRGCLSSASTVGTVAGQS